MRLHHAPLLAALLASPAAAQIPLYAQRLPEGTVYIRLANTLPGAATVDTSFAGMVALGADGPGRISPYFVAGEAGGKTLTLRVNSDGQDASASLTPPSGRFITVLLQPEGTGVVATTVLDKPEYNQVKARLSFYNAAADCPAASLAEAAGRAVFSAVPPGGVQARSVNPTTATLVAGCGADKTPPLPLGELQAGGLYTVWLMRPAGQLSAFVAHDTIAPPRS